VRDALQSIPKAAVGTIASNLKHAGQEINGWTFSTHTGDYGTDYLQRATIAFFGLGANRPEDAVYPTSDSDANGKPYDGANRYVIHFDKGQMPPAKAFWSITMYDSKLFFVPNKLDRYNINSRNALRGNIDGSVDLYIQKDSPGAGTESNWLPAPAGKFVLMMRIYWPNDKPPSILDGSWQPPAVVQVTPVTR
jgi:hypothetical protein